MIIIRGPSEFLMGSPPNEPQRDKDETLHRKWLGRSYAIAAKEVTVETSLNGSCGIIRGLATPT